MTHPCQRKNPLLRSGTDRQSASLPALATDYFKVDERNLDDFILFARRYSANIKFYGDATHNNWQTFFESDISVTLARMASLPLSHFITFKDALIRYLNAAESETDDVQCEYFSLFMQLPLLLLSEISECKSKLPVGDPLILQLEKWAIGELNEDLLLLKSFVLGAEQLPLTGYTDSVLDKNLFNTNAAVISDTLLLPEKIEQSLSSLNCSDTLETIFNAFESLDSGQLAVVTANSAPFENASGLHEQIDGALRYNLLVNAVENLLSVVQVVTDLASVSLEKAMLRDDHDPSYGLWLTFLRLYQHPQDLLNQFTQRHLDFYYRDILQLKNQPKQGDRVALVLELAKQHREYLLEAGTQFSAGKDDDGIARLYQLESDTVFNQAKIAQLKSFYHFHQAGKSIPYAAIKADSLDGVDEKLDKTTPQWPAFGPAHINSQANIGFAIADERLRLSDGHRTIECSVAISGTFPSQIQNIFTAALTTEEEWLALTDQQLSVQRVDNTLVFKITLAGDVVAITPYVSDVHAFNFSSSLPILRIWLKPESARFNDWISVQFTQVFLSSQVMASRMFSLRNDSGVIDSAKPFMPFGPQPKENSHLLLGGKELFSKPLSELTLHPIWQEKLGDSSHYRSDINSLTTKTKIEWLKKGQWVSPVNSEFMPFLAHASDDEAFTKLDLPAVQGSGLLLSAEAVNATYQALNEQYKPSSSSGFVRFTLQNDFGHMAYPQENALAMIAKATPGGNYDGKIGVNAPNGIPLQPYTPVISELTIDYQTTATLPQQFYHQLPFGVQESSGSNNTLLPAFTNEGELYIGLEKALPPQSVSLLFEAIEGSANPLKNPATLAWHYLTGNQWVEIPSVDITDSSAALSGSGIVSFELPKDADTEHQILPSDLHWLRVSVDKDVDAVCALSAIYAQAISVVWLDNNNAENILETPLSASSISKLMIPNTTVKKISQPQASFGGKPQEQDVAYYHRVSERLRHKNRAVTIWDYEHLVLQQFPQVFKVRCLNHTALCLDENNKVQAENGLHPGSVLVVPIPQIDSASASDPHRPYNTTKTLADIDSYLRKRISPFVNMDVKNPKIEEIQLKFFVSFHTHILDTGFYIKLLNEEIKQCLMPWANNHQASIDFNGCWYKSALVNFIEERPYVDFIKDVLMSHRKDINDPSSQWQSLDNGVITASSAHSILVSYKQHDIQEYVGVSA